MALKDILQKDQRLVILRVLSEMAGYSANESILDDAMDSLGHNVSRDKVKTEMNYLEEQGLLTLEESFGTMVATITSRGLDVATGQATHHGVKRPRPE